MNIRLAIGAAAGFGALALAGSLAVAQPSAGGQACLRISHIQSTHFADPHTLFIRADGNQFYRLEFGPPCYDAANETLIVHPFANNDMVCSAIGLNISVRATGERCIPTRLTRLSPDEAAAIPPRDRP